MDEMQNATNTQPTPEATTSASEAAAQATEPHVPSAETAPLAADIHDEAPVASVDSATIHASNGSAAHVEAASGDETPADDAAEETASASEAHEVAEPIEDENRPPKGPLELIETQVGPTGNRLWYILKVQSNREDSIREALIRKINIAGLNDYFGEIIVPVEKRTEFKNGKRRVVRQKLYPGYIVVNMELNDDTWYLVRDTNGIGDFTGSGGKPSPMPESEVAKIITKHEEKIDEAPKLKINFNPGDRVKIIEGTFENFEGDVDGIDQANGRVTVMINIFGRSTPVELEYWQIEAL